MGGGGRGEVQRITGPAGREEEVENTTKEREGERKGEGEGGASDR